MRSAAERGNVVLEPVGTVSSIRRYPVKSMLGEVLDSAVITTRGLEGDRVYALTDNATGKVVSVKRPRRWLRIFDLRAIIDDDRVWIVFPDGVQFAIGDPILGERLDRLFGRSVSVSSVPPANATFDESWVRDLKAGAPPYFGRASRIDDGDEIVDAGASMGEDGNFFNDSPIHVVTTSTIRTLAAAAPDTRFDAHRFRPNLVIDTEEPGFLETEWQGRTLEVGSVILTLSMTVPRCVMTTLAQEDLPADADVLRTITRLNSGDTLGTGIKYPCVGIYAEVRRPGAIATGDAVVLR